MTKTPDVLINRTQKGVNPDRSFIFSSDDIIPGPLEELRRNAFKIFMKTPFPTANMEAWRRSDLSKMPVESFTLAKYSINNDEQFSPSGYKRSHIIKRSAGSVFIGSGNSKVLLEQSIKNQGIIYSDLRTAENKNKELISHVAGKIVRAEDGKFAALATAFSQDGIFLYVPKGVKIEDPLNGFLWGEISKSAFISHVILWLDDYSSVNYLLESGSSDNIDTMMHVGNIEIHVGRGATLQIIDTQSFGRSTWNITHSRAKVEQDGNLDWIVCTAGSKFSKSFFHIDLVGEGAKGRLSGLYLIDSNQHIDIDTKSNHQAPYTTSDSLFKGALTGTGKGIWRGMIYVAPGADKTDGYQANKNLILSKNAHADSIPGLEILADDVRCTHGSTITNLEDEPLFYLESRGIPRNISKQLLVQGFFNPILERIPYTYIQRKYSRMIQKKVQTQ